MERKTEDGARAPGSSQETQPKVGNHISSDVSETKGPPASNPQPQPEISSHYPALAFGGTITVCQSVTTNVSQNTASVVRRPGPASETLTREQETNRSISLAPSSRSSAEPQPASSRLQEWIESQTHLKTGTKGKEPSSIATKSSSGRVPPKQKVQKKKALKKPRAREEALARRAIKKQAESTTHTPDQKPPAPAKKTQNPAPKAHGLSRKTQEALAAAERKAAEKKAALNNRFPNFAKFQKPKPEGYKYLRKDYALTKGCAAGPNRLDFSRGCLSQLSYVAPAPYPQVFKTMTQERWDLKEKWSLKHALSLGVMRVPVDHGLIRYRQLRVPVPAPQISRIQGNGETSAAPEAHPSDGSSLRFLAAPKKPIDLGNLGTGPRSSAGLSHGSGLGSTSASGSHENQTSRDTGSHPWDDEIHSVRFQPATAPTGSRPMFSTPSRDMSDPQDAFHDIGLHTVPEVSTGPFTFSPPRDTEEIPLPTFFEDAMWAMAYRDLGPKSPSEGYREENPVDVDDDDSDHHTSA